MNELHIPEEVLAICRTAGWELYKVRSLVEAEVVARGLVAADPFDWYHHALLAQTLQKQERFADAIAQVDEGLDRLPCQMGLIGLRRELVAAAAKVKPPTDGAGGSSDGGGDDDPPDDGGAAALTVRVLDESSGDAMAQSKSSRQQYMDMIRLVTSILETRRFLWDHAEVEAPQVAEIVPRESVR